MRKLWIFVLLFMGSSVWAQDTATPSSQETPMAAVQGSSWGSVGSPIAVSTAAESSTSAGVKSSSTGVDPASTPGGAVSPSATASGTPSVLPKPQPLSVAATPVASNPVGEHLVVQLDGGFVTPISSAASSIYGMGLGLDARVGYAFDDVFSIGLETGFYDLSATAAALSSAPGGYHFPAGATSDLSHVPVLFDMQIYFGDSGAPIQPYLILAAGLAFDAVNLQGAPYKPGVIYSWANFEFDPAIGVAFMLDRNTNIFIQSKWAMDFDDYNTTDPNVESADTPIMLIPLQVGFSLSL